MPEVDDHFGETWFQVLHCIDIELSPLVCANGGAWPDPGTQEDGRFGEDGDKCGGSGGKPDSQKRQLVFMSDFDVDGEEFRCGEERAHVAVQMRGMNSESDGAVDLGTNFTLGFLRLQIPGRGQSFWPQIAGWIEEACDFVS